MPRTVADESAMTRSGSHYVIQHNPDNSVMLIAVIAGGMFLYMQIQNIPKAIGQQVANVGQGAGSALATTGAGVGGAVAATGGGVVGPGGFIGGIFNAVGTGLGSIVNPSNTMVRQVYQFHDDGLCWFDQQFADGHWSSQGPVDAKNCGG